MRKKNFVHRLVLQLFLGPQPQMTNLNQLKFYLLIIFDFLWQINQFFSSAEKFFHFFLQKIFSFFSSAENFFIFLPVSLRFPNRGARSNSFAPISRDVFPGSDFFIKPLCDMSCSKMQTDILLFLLNFWLKNKNLQTKKSTDLKKEKKTEKSTEKSTGWMEIRKKCLNVCRSTRAQAVGNRLQ